MRQILFCYLFLALFPKIAVAQITPDSSLGSESSKVERDGKKDTINGGAKREGNLFHSFEDFNVQTTREAYFANPEGVNNIFSRVTGNNISNIDGVLGVAGNANLYLINPNGILFGENSRLDVNGSFFATSADSVLFENGIEFSAADRNVPPLLTVDIPLGLKFRDNPGDIINRSQYYRTEAFDEFKANILIGLEVKQGQDLALIGGNITLENTAITASGGRVTIGGLSEKGTVIFDAERNFIFPDDVKKADVFLKERRSLQDISDEKKSFDELKNQLRDEIKSLGEVKEEVVSNQAYSTNGKSPESPIIEEDEIEASAFIRIVDPTFSFAKIIFNNGGAIDIHARNLRLENAWVSSIINENTSIDNATNGIKLNADRISLENSFITYSVYNNSTNIRQSIGNIILNSDFISLKNSFITYYNSGDTRRKIGRVALNTDSLFLSKKSQISSITDSQQQAANVVINSNRLVKVIDKGSAIVSSTFGSGNAGNVTINTSELRLLNGGEINADNFIDELIFTSSEDRIERIKLRQPKFGIGNAGQINITASDIILRNQGKIIALSRSGKGGNINLKVANLLSLKNNSEISATAGSGNTSGDGGNINIDAKFIVAFPSNNDILANAFDGSGGTIEISTNGIFGIEQRIQNDRTSDINASSDFGLSGQVNIDGTDVDPNSSLLELKSEIIDASQLITQNVCQQTANSEFVDIGKGGLPKNPNTFLQANSIEVGLVAPTLTSEKVLLNGQKNRDTMPERTPRITSRETRKPPAQGWIQRDNGLVELVAQNPYRLGEQRNLHNGSNC